MITEDYVSFETAKLLKEKGFNEPCQFLFFSKYKQEGDFIGNFHARKNSEINEASYSAPTLQMVMKWLREKHNQNVTVKAHNNVARLKTIYYAEVQNLSNSAEKSFCVNGCIFKDTYEEAVEYAINYCLVNLI